MLAVFSGVKVIIHAPIYKVGDYLRSDLDRTERGGLHQVPDTAGTGITTMGYTTSPRTMHTAILSKATYPLFAFQAFTTVSGEVSTADYLYTRGQLSDNVANIFIKHAANSQRHLRHSLDNLPTHPSQRRHHHAHELLNGYRKWCLLQHMKTRSKHPRQRHHHHRIQFIAIIIVSGRHWLLQQRLVQQGVAQRRLVE